MIVTMMMKTDGDVEHDSGLHVCVYVRSCIQVMPEDRYIVEKLTQ